MDSFQIQPQQQLQMPPKNSFGPSMQPYLPPTNHKKRNLIILFCVLAAIAIFAGIAWISYTNSAGYRVKRGIMRLAKEAEALKNPMHDKLGTEALCRMQFAEGLKLDTRMDVTFDTYLGEFTLGVDTDYAKDMKNKEMSSSTTLSIMNYEFGHLDVYADKNDVCFSVPELFLKDMYLENENVLDQYNHSMWAEDWLLGEVQGDDFSIDLFSRPWYFGKEEEVGAAFLNRYATEIDACRLSMEMERLGDGLYRVSVDSICFNILIWQMMIDWLDDNMNSSVAYRQDIMGFMNYFNGAADQERVSFLLEITERDRIESIRLEEPLSLGRGAVCIDGDIYFLGGENSLEKMQGRISFDNKNGEGVREQELLWEVVRSLEEGEYRMESEAKYSFLQDRTKETMKLTCDFSYSGPKNSFETKAGARTKEAEIALEASGDFSHIVKGEGFDLELDEVRFLLDGEDFLRVKGEVGLSPLSGRVKQVAEPKNALFAMDEGEWIDILLKIDEEYGYLWGTVMEYLQ